MTHVQKLANFYLELLSIDPDDKFRVLNQNLYAAVRFTLAMEIKETEQTVQRVFERMAKK